MKRSSLFVKYELLTMLRKDKLAEEGLHPKAILGDDRVKEILEVWKGKFLLNEMQQRKFLGNIRTRLGPLHADLGSPGQPIQLKHLNCTEKKN